MTYTPTKPDPGPSPLVDAPLIQSNFSTFASVFSSTSGGIKYNHTPMNDTNQGKHESVILQERTVSPIDPTITNTYDVIYSKTDGTQLALFVSIPTFLPTANDPTQGPFAPLHMTYPTVNTAGPQYQSFLPGGNILYWGTTTSKNTVITLSPAPSSILFGTASIVTTVAGYSQDGGITILSSSTFEVNSSSTGAQTWLWFIIGTQ